MTAAAFFATSAIGSRAQADLETLVRAGDGTRDILSGIAGLDFGPVRSGRAGLSRLVPGFLRRSAGGDAAMKGLSDLCGRLERHRHDIGVEVRRSERVIGETDMLTASLREALAGIPSQETGADDATNRGRRESLLLSVGIAEDFSARLRRRVAHGQVMIERIGVALAVAEPLAGNGCPLGAAPDPLEARRRMAEILSSVVTEASRLSDQG